MSDWEGELQAGTTMFRSKAVGFPGAVFHMPCMSDQVG